MRLEAQHESTGINCVVDIRFFYICAPDSLAILIHPHALNFCSLFSTPLPEPSELVTADVAVGSMA